MDDAYIAKMTAAMPCTVWTDPSSGGTYYFTCPARVAFAALLEPSAMKDQPNATPKYSATLLFHPSADLTVLKQAAIAAAQAHFGPRFDSVKASLKNPFRNQGERAAQYKGFVEGGIFLNVSSLYKPAILDKTGAFVDDPSAVYSGMWARAKLTVYGYDKAGNRGVAFGLQSMQKLADDEAFSTGGNAAAGYDAMPSAAGFGGPATASAPKAANGAASSGMAW